MDVELISRAYVLAEYDRQHKGPPGGARKIMEEAPAVDAVPVVHGRWIRQSGSAFVFKCSACEFKFAGVAIAKHCPNCGAKMDGE